MCLLRVNRWAFCIHAASSLSVRSCEGVVKLRRVCCGSFDRARLEWVVAVGAFGQAKPSLALYHRRLPCRL